MSKSIGTKVGGEIVKKGDVGQLHHMSLFLCQGFGEGKYEDVGIDISATLGGEPIVRNKKNGKQFLLKWKDIVNLGAAAGLFDDDEPVYLDQDRDVELDG